MSDSQPSIDLKLMTVPQLSALIEKATAMRAEKMEDAKTEARAQMEAIAAGLGLSVHDLITQPAVTQEPPANRRRGSGKRASTGAKVAPKYRNPTTGDTWSGRGREPKWLSGKNRADFAIEG